MAKLKLHKPENGKTPDKEVIRIEVLEDTNLKNYCIADRTFVEGEETDVFRHFFRFPNWPVEKGDWVRLHTSLGKNHTIPKKDKKATTHQIYWGSNKCVWNDTGDTAYLLYLNKLEEVDVPSVA